MGDWWAAWLARWLRMREGVFMRWTPWMHGLAAVLCATPLMAHAARPMNTDDALVVDDRSCQLESWA